MNGQSSINPAVVNEFVVNLTKQIKAFKEVSDRFSQTGERLSSWNSPNKTALEEQIKANLPAFAELEEVVSSYRDVAASASKLAIEGENEIARSFM